MDAASVVAASQNVQSALSLANAVLQVTTYLWLPGACVEDKAVYDYIVIGAGTSGGVVAKRLSENKDLKILLIEAGGDPTLESVLPGLVSYAFESKELHYKFQTEKNNRIQQCHQKNPELGLGKCLGGTSSVNNMLYGIGTQKDYSRWAAAADDSSWEWEGVLPYFKKLENLRDPAIKKSPTRDFHGYDGPMIVTPEDRPEIYDYLNAFAEVGYDVVSDLNSNISLGYTYGKYTKGNGSRQGTAMAYLAPKEDIPNLDILKNTEVQRIKFDQNKNAIGVVAIGKNNKTITIMAKREVISCAGVVNSAKLLMVSGIGPQKDLESKNITVLSDLPVGENYQDHVSVRAIYKLGKGCKPVRPYDIHLTPYPSIVGFVALNKSSTDPDYVTHIFIQSNDKVAETVLNSCILINGFADEICEKYYKEVKGRKVFNSYIRVTQPRSRGKVMLRSSDPSDPPIIDTGLFSDEADLKRYPEIMRDFLKIGESKYFKDQNAEFVDPTESACGEFEYDSDDYWRCYTQCLAISAGEGVGTCSIGSVVDSRLRVKGVKRLRVADESVIPYILVSSTYAPTVMVGEKAADMIIQDME